MSAYYNQEGEALVPIGLDVELSRWNRKIHELATSPRLRDLRKEIGCLRLLLSEILVAATTSKALLRQGPRILKICGELARLALVQQRLQTREAPVDLEPFLQALSRILASVITDPALLERIAAEIAALAG